MTTKQSSRQSFEPFELKEDQEYMCPQQLAHFKNILLLWKKSLMEEVERTVNHLKDEQNVLADPNDRATQEEEFNIELKTRDRERKLIYKIDLALKQIENNDYGYCENCDIEIGVRRLEARPTATLCIDCKTLNEIREKHMAG